MAFSPNRSAAAPPVAAPVDELYLRALPMPAQGTQRECGGFQVRVHRRVNALQQALAFKPAQKGAQVEVVTPGGARAFEVTKVEWR